jgi:hypothetical protein
MVEGMSVIAFPPQTLTSEDEAAILEQLRRLDYYSCCRDRDEAGTACITLLDRNRSERGRIEKRHGVYLVMDARGYAILRTRRLDEVLCALTE